MTEPNLCTELPPAGTLTVANLAAILHWYDGTIGPVAVYPRGCRTCERAVDLAREMGMDIPPLYAD